MFGVDRIQKEHMDAYLLYCERAGVDFTAGHSTIWK